MIAWAIEALLASAVLIALVLVARAPVRRLFGAEVAYLLWALPVLRLLLPPLPAAAPAPLAAAGERLALLVLPAPAPEAGPPIAGLLLVAAWCVGALLFLARHLLGYRRFVRRVAAEGREIGRFGRIALVISQAVGGPLAFGVVRPVVAVPVDFRARYSRDERELALAHEVAHHRRGDIAATWVALGCLALHWFNPLAFIAFRAFRADQEMANDAHVMAGRSAAERHAYACAIARAAGAHTPAAACGLHSIETVKGRLRMLKQTTSRARRIAGALGVAGVTLALLGLTASGSEAANTVRTHVEQATGVPLDALTPAALFQAEPAPPAPPMPPAPPAPPAPGHGGRHVEAIRDGRGTHVTVTEDGRTRHLEGEAADAWLAAHPVPTPPAPPSPPKPGHPPVPPVPPVPPAPPAPGAEADAALLPANVHVAIRDLPRVVAEDCRGGDPAGMTEERREGGRRVIVICKGRIEAAARRAELAAVDAGRIRRDAMTTALASLRRTRAGMADGRGLQGLSPEQRGEALKGIDRSIAELERETAARD